MPFYSGHRVVCSRKNNFYLYTARPTYRGVYSTHAVSNLIISAKSVIILEAHHTDHMFLVLHGFRLSFYCPHGTRLVSHPVTPNPVYLMYGEYEAYETITDGQPCFNYTICPDPAFNCEMARGRLINSYIDTLVSNRKERDESKKDKYPAHNYDILVPDSPVSLRQLLQEVKKRYPQYYHFHCLFSRTDEFIASEKYNLYKLPPRFHQGGLGRWELLDKEPDAGAGFSAGSGPRGNDLDDETWLFIETSFSDYGATSE